MDHLMAREAQIHSILERPLVLVGLMGAGKTFVGERLAEYLNIPFVDTDAEIEAEVGCSVKEIFNRYGEDFFRRVEQDIIVKSLDKALVVVATGGGAFMNKDSRARILASAISVWLKADMETTFSRVGKTGSRPLLKTDNPKQTLRQLMETRYPVYGEADIMVESSDNNPDEDVRRIVCEIERFYQQKDKQDAGLAGGSRVENKKNSF